ncbi:MAG: hypothetical protein HFK09_04310 [Clostridia bacterium]|nr:hypothetical protein [Clostridia bacterium]
MESVILTTPVLLLLYAAALALIVFDRVKKASGYIFTALSAAVFCAASAYALLSGARLEEIGTATLVFLVVYLSAFYRQGDEKK